MEISREITRKSCGCQATRGGVFWAVAVEAFIFAWGVELAGQDQGQSGLFDMPLNGNLACPLISQMFRNLAQDPDRLFALRLTQSHHLRQRFHLLGVATDRIEEQVVRAHLNEFLDPCTHLLRRAMDP